MHKVRKYQSGALINYNSGVNQYLDSVNQILHNSFSPTLRLNPNIQQGFTGFDIGNVLKDTSLNSSDLIIQNAAEQARKNAEERARNNNGASTTEDADIKKSKFSSGMNIASSVAPMAFDTIANIGGFEKNDTMDSIYDTASSVAKSFGPWGQVAGLAIDAWNFIDKGLGKAFTNEKLQRGFEGQTGSSSYADFSTQGKSLRLTQLGAQDKLLAQRNAKAQQYAKAMSNVATNRQAVQARAQAADNMNTTFQNRKAGGVSGSLLTAKNGGVLRSIKTVISKANRNFIINSPIYIKDLSVDKEINEDVKMFKDGGAVIPSGALHKNKHHLEEVDESLNKNITSKGIPVITIEDGGEIKQHAEIEKEEIILSLSLTKQIEKLWKEGTEEAAIEAGKLFTIALMEDTEDNVGLIEKVKNENKG